VIELKVNGRSHNVSADPDTPLLYVLRDDLQLNAAKFGCGLGQCGSCTVLVDGAPTLSCVTPIMLLEGRQITTLEGLGSLEDPGPLQRAFIEEQAAQCGYCIPGMMMRAQALLQRNPHASDAEIRAHLEPNLCRCGTHMRILRAVRRAATLIAGPGSSPGTPATHAASAAGPQLDTSDTDTDAQGDARSRPAHSEKRERPER
jgi:nicotinate dehydrogenase subunit A